MAKRDKKTYFTVFALRDGTITTVLESRKPRQDQLRRGQRIDEDGVYQEHTTDARTYENHTDAQRIQKHITIAGAINTRRAIRNLLLPKLKEISEQLFAVQERLDAIDKRVRRD